MLLIDIGSYASSGSQYLVAITEDGVWLGFAVLFHGVGIWRARHVRDYIRVLLTP